MDGKFVSYIRVSTAKQGHSGIGLEAQQATISNFLNGGKWSLLAEFVEVESGRKGSKHRTQLVAAIAACKKHKAQLIVAKLDRLARDVRYFLEVLDSGVAIRFAEFPDIDPTTPEGRMILVNMANFAEFEGRRIGQRTKAGLAVVKARGVVLGKAGPANLKPNIEERKQAADQFANRLRHTFNGMKASGLSQRGMVKALNDQGTPAPRGGKWSLLQVQRVLGRLAI